jgi:hypothetical protein
MRSLGRGAAQDSSRLSAARLASGSAAIRGAAKAGPGQPLAAGLVSQIAMSTTCAGATANSEAVSSRVRALPGRLAEQ